MASQYKQPMPTLDRKRIAEIQTIQDTCYSVVYAESELVTQMKKAIGELRGERQGYLSFFREIQEQLDRLIDVRAADEATVSIRNSIREILTATGHA